MDSAVPPSQSAVTGTVHERIAGKSFEKAVPWDEASETLREKDWLSVNGSPLAGLARSRPPARLLDPLRPVHAHSLPPADKLAFCRWRLHRPERHEHVLSIHLSRSGSFHARVRELPDPPSRDRCHICPVVEAGAASMASVDGSADPRAESCSLPSRCSLWYLCNPEGRRYG